MSLYELWLEFEIAATTRRDQFERDTILAWQVKRIDWMTENQKRLPTLSSLLKSERKRTLPAPGRPTLEQQRLAFEQISRQYGIPITEVKTEAHGK